MAMIKVSVNKAKTAAKKVIKEIRKDRRKQYRETIAYYANRRNFMVGQRWGIKKAIRKIKNPVNSTHIGWARRKCEYMWCNQENECFKILRLCKVPPCDSLITLTGQNVLDLEL